VSAPSYDVVVVGAGTAGIPCAVEAASAGLRVLVVDKSARVGGTLHWSGGHMSAAGARRQRERGIQDTPDDHFADVLRISGGTVREDLARLAVDGAAATVDWLGDAGLDFHPSTPRVVHGHEPYRVARTYYGTDEGRSILAVLAPMLEDAVASGRVELRLSTPMRRLVVEQDRVVGVGLDGGDVVRAPAVVLATGGYGADAELFRALDRAPLVTAAAPESTGDGLRAAQEVGAALQGQGTFLPTFGGLPPADGSGRVTWHDRPLLVATERPPWEVYVDRSGARWVAEDEESIDAKERALVAVEDMTFWQVFDDRALEESRPMVVGWSPDDLRAKAGARAGVTSAATLRGLATAAGIEPDGLERTVARYNEAVARGVDVDLGRLHLPAPIERPPFYALQNHGVTLITFTGLDVDAGLRVRRGDGSVVPGLYAVGEVIGAGATTGNSFCGGMVVTPALTLGRLLGSRLRHELPARLATR
jgi:glycine/D-amino acid oxidase-like deaminating enzyme